MKKSKTILLIFVVLFMFCGQKPEATKTEMGNVATKEVAMQVLTEGELTRFIKAFPVFKTEAQKKNIEWEGLDPQGNVLAQTDAFIKAHKDLAEIDAKMRAAGMALEEFWPALAKTSMAFAAVMIDSAMGEARQELEKSKKEIAEMEAKLNDPKISATEKSMIKMALEASKGLMEGIGSMAAIYDSIPAASKDAVKKHMAELKVLFEAAD
ncbi:MAG TPA: hypothetical protein VF399_09250 [bacterium]|jgi:hypothetical protein